jgi:hypothetical protein
MMGKGLSLSLSSYHSANFFLYYTHLVTNRATHREIKTHFHPTPTTQLYWMSGMLSLTFHSGRTRVKQQIFDILLSRMN